MTTPQTKKEAYELMLSNFHDHLSNSGCNDFCVANTPELYALVEQAGADNLRLSLEDFRNSSDYDDYKPQVSTDGSLILTSDYIFLAIIQRELGLK